MGLTAELQRRVVTGGSHLCAPKYCLFRPAARQGETMDTSRSRVGFCCVVRAEGQYRSAPSGPLTRVAMVLGAAIQAA
jgi:hypothetical protein